MTDTNVLVTEGSCATLQDEYWYHVASQSEMPLAGAARDRSDFTRLSKRLTGDPIDEDSLIEWLVDDPDLAEDLRLVTSLSDKRFYLDLSYAFSRHYDPDNPSSTLCGCAPNTMKKHTTRAIINLARKGSLSRRKAAASVIANYLIERNVILALDTLSSLPIKDRTAIANIWLFPREAQQNEAKRRGHGAEAEIAGLIDLAKVSIVPPDKATNPMGSNDPNISRADFSQTTHHRDDSFSTDLLVFDEKGSMRVMVMALVQSSDPGQFGVDKTKTNAAIRELLDKHNQANNLDLEMWGIIDGIGYAENPRGTIYPMLTDFHMFIQHHSAYKVFLGLHRLGLTKVRHVSYHAGRYSPCNAQIMHERYADASITYDLVSPQTYAEDGIVAGWACVYLGE